MSVSSIIFSEIETRVLFDCGQVLNHLIERKPSLMTAETGLFPMLGQIPSRAGNYNGRWLCHTNSDENIFCNFKLNERKHHRRSTPHYIKPVNEGPRQTYFEDCCRS